MACEGDLRGPGRAARSSSLRVADTRSSGAQLCAHLRSGLQLRSDTAAHRRRGIIDVVISLRRSNRPHRLNVALAAYGQVALDDLYQRWRVFTDRAVAITQTATVRLTKQVTVDLVLVEIPERALVRQSVRWKSGISYTFITSGAVRQAVGTIWFGSTNCSGLPSVCLWDIVHLHHQRRRQAGSRHERVHQLLRLPRTAGQHLQEQTDPALPLRAAAIRQDRRQLLLQAALEHLKRRYFRVE